MYVNFCKIAICSFDSTKMAPKIKMEVQTFFLVVHVLIFLFLGKLGKIWASVDKI